MAFDGIVCSAIVDELNNSILDGKINKIFEPNKNEIILGIYSNGQNFALDVCIDYSNYRINLSTHSKPNPQNVLGFCMVLRKHLTGATIKRIYMNGLERVVYIDMEAYNELNDTVTKTLIVELMGKHSNLILVDNNNQIIDSLKHLSKFENSIRDIMPGYNYVSINSNKLDFTTCSFDNFYKSIYPLECSDLSTAISNLFTGFSKFGVNCILESLNITNTLDISLNDCKRIYEYFRKLILYPNNFSLINVDKNFYFNDAAKSSDIQNNFFIDDFYYEKEKKEKFINSRDNLLHTVLEKINKLKNKLKTANATLEDCKNMDTYKLYGELITSNLYRINNINQSSISIENYYNNNNIIDIPLDKSISPANNAKKYFKKYRKLQNAYTIMQKQEELIQNEISYLDSIVFDINNAENTNDIYEIEHEISNDFDINKKQTSPDKVNNKNSAAIPTEYKIDGYTILVGKNSRQNDYLTCKLAKSSDLWFHTKDIHSSHVVLKLDKNIKQLPDSIIYKCATITAFFSKAKLSQNVPVDYTFIKYVHKPNGAKPGMVIYTDNKTLYVNPKNPKEYN